jgi:hypothetical protein
MDEDGQRVGAGSAATPLREKQELGVRQLFLLADLLDAGDGRSAAAGCQGTGDGPLLGETAGGL